MKKLLGIFYLILPILVPGYLFASPILQSPDPVYQLFEDESDRMIINQLPLELDPISLGFDASTEEQIKKFLNPSFIERILTDQIGFSVQLPGNVIAEKSKSSIETSVRAGPRVSEPILMERAETFQETGLLPVAREQYAYILQFYPHNKEATNALGNLNSIEIDRGMKGALAAQKRGDLDEALFQINHALSISPKNPEAMDLKRKLLQEQKLNKEMGNRISKEYLKGIEHYQNGQLDMALSCFVRVLNLDSSHQGALDYIKKIEGRLTPENSK